MIKNIIFDYGGVLLDWNPHYLYDPYFGDVDKAEWFLTNICTYEWNAQHDTAQNIPGEPSNGGFPQIGQRNGAATERHRVSRESMRGVMVRPQRFFE